MSTDHKDVDQKVINLLDNLKPRKPRCRKGKPEPAICQTVTGGGLIQVGQVHGDLVVRQEAPRLRPPRVNGNTVVYIITGEAGEERELPSPGQPQTNLLPDYDRGVIYFFLATGISFLMYPYFDLTNLIMLYFLLGVMVTALQYRRGPAIPDFLPKAGAGPARGSPDPAGRHDG
jgi:hypothetical protein